MRMIRHLPFAGAFVLLLVAVAALAAPPYVAIEQRLTAEQRHDTGLDTLSPVQLELLNRLLRDEAVAADAARPATSNAAAVADPARVDAAAGTSGGVGRADVPRADAPGGRGSFIGLEDGPIKSRLKGSVTSWKPGTEFALENGQVWKVLKGSVTLRKTLVAPEVIVVPGVAGRWFLQVDEDIAKPRVYRID